MKRRTFLKALCVGLIATKCGIDLINDLYFVDELTPLSIYVNGDIGKDKAGYGWTELKPTKTIDRAWDLLPRGHKGNVNIYISSGNYYLKKPIPLCKYPDRVISIHGSYGDKSGTIGTIIDGSKICQT